MILETIKGSMVTISFYPSELRNLAQLCEESDLRIKNNVWFERLENWAATFRAAMVAANHQQEAGPSGKSSLAEVEADLAHFFPDDDMDAGADAKE